MSQVSFLESERREEELEAQVQQKRNLNLSYPSFELVIKPVSGFTYLEYHGSVDTFPVHIETLSHYKRVPLEL